MRKRRKAKSNIIWGDQDWPEAPEAGAEDEQEPRRRKRRRASIGEAAPRARSSSGTSSDSSSGSRIHSSNRPTPSQSESGSSSTSNPNGPNSSDHGEVLEEELDAEVDLQAPRARSGRGENWGVFLFTGYGGAGTTRAPGM